MCSIGAACYVGYSFFTESGIAVQWYFIIEQPKHKCREGKGTKALKLSPAVINQTIRSFFMIGNRLYQKKRVYLHFCLVLPVAGGCWPAGTEWEDKNT